MKRIFLLFVITTMVASIASARLGSALKGLRYKPRYHETIRPIIIGGFASSAYHFSENGYQYNAVPSATYYNTMAATPVVQTNDSCINCTNEDSPYSISQTAANTHVGAANTTESGLSVWLYILFGMMALAIITFIYMLLDDGVDEDPVVSRQVLVATKPSPYTIELANNGGIMIF